MKAADIKWYQDGNELLQPLRYHMHSLLEYVERDEMPPPRIIEDARRCSEKAEEFFTNQKKK